MFRSESRRMNMDSIRIHESPSVSGVSLKHLHRAYFKFQPIHGRHIPMFFLPRCDFDHMTTPTSEERRRAGRWCSSRIPGQGRATPLTRNVSGRKLLHCISYSRPYGVFVSNSTSVENSLTRDFLRANTLEKSFASTWRRDMCSTSIPHYCAILKTIPFR